MSDQPTLTTFTPEEIDAFSPTMKVGLVATLNPDGLPISP